MTVTFTGDVVFKTRLFNALTKNELGGTSAYSISFADPNSKSGWSFGWTQMDVRNNASARGLLESILLNAIDSSGNFIVDDGNPKTTRPNDTEVQRLVAAASQNSATVLTAADRALIDSALASTYGANAIDAAVDVEFNALIAIATHVQGLASTSNQPFLGTDLARIFVIDYANQYTIDAGGDFEQFISGSSASVGRGTVQIDGSLGVDDLLNFYFHLEYPWKNPTDPIRRFGNIAAETGYTPAGADEAKNVFRAATYFLHAPNQLSRIRGSSGGQATLNTFVETVLDPARTTLIAALQTQTPTLAARLAGLDSLSIYVDPIFAVQDPNNSAVLDSRLFDTQGTELANNDLLIGDGGTDTLTGGLGDDILMGGAGNDYLRGGAGEDVYVYRTGEGTDWIRDAGRDGSIIFDGVTLSGAGAQQWIDPHNPSMPAWRAEISGHVFYFRLHDANVSASGIVSGSLWIQAEGAAVDQRVVVEGFETRIVNGSVVGDLGLDLPVGPLIMWYVTVNGIVNNPFTLPTLPPPIDPIQLQENLSQMPSIALNAPAAAGQVLRISASTLADNLQIVTGAETLSFVDGHVDLILVEGQTLVTFSLLTRGDIAADTTVNLTAELLPLGGGTGPTSNLVVNVVADTGAPLAPPEATGIVVGTSGDDSLPRTGDDGNVFRGLGGNDTIIAPTFVSAVIEGGTGDDILHAGSLNGWLHGDEGRDFVFGHDGADHLEGGTESDYLDGGANRDELFGDHAIAIADAIANGETDPGSTARGDILQGGAGNDTIVGTAGVDLLGGHTGKDLLIGGAGNDLIAGDRHFLFPDPSATSLDNWGFTPGVVVRPDGSLGIPLSGDIFELIDFPVGDADRIYAGAGDDLVVAGDGEDVVEGGGGNDLMYGESGDDTLLGQAGNDTLHGDGNAGANGRDFIDGGDDDDALYGNENSDVLYGGSGNDTLVGDNADASAGDDYLNGEDGNDVLSGAAGADALYGGTGDDQLYGDSSSTAAEHQGDDYLEGGGGADLLVGSGGADTLIGGEDADSLYGDASDTPIAALGDDYLDGGAGNDLMIGGGGADLLFGGDGADEIHGDAAGLIASAQGDDHLDGGAGDDVLVGDGGHDVLLGGEGNDQLFGDASDTPAGGFGNDYLDGGDGNDTLSGLVGDDLIFGGAGVDSLSGGDGNDDLYGGDGNDTLNGGVGNDTLSGGAGVDSLAGGAGDDTYIIDAADLLVAGGLREVISDNQGNNQVIINGLSSADVTLAAGQTFGDVTLVLDATHQVSLQGGLAGNTGNYRFADEQALMANQLIGRYYNANANQSSTAVGAYLLGGTLNDTITGSGEGALISGGHGNDILTGGDTKRTTFLFELGDGADTINDRGNNVVGGQLMTNSLLLGEGIDKDSLGLECAQGTLTIRVAGTTTDSMRLQRFTATDVLNGSRTLDEFRFSDGSVLTWQQLVTQRGIDVVNTTGTSFLDGTNVSDRILGHTTSETINGQAGDDVIYGMAGNDTLNGGTGSDTYVYGRDHGNDIVNNTDEATTTDRLLFDETMAPSDVRWYRYDDTLIARFVDTAGRIILNNFFTSGTLDLIEFAADGTTFTPATLTLSSPDTQATASADEIYGSQLADVIDALDGDDQLFGGRGDDTLTGGAGNDTVRGEAGNDTLTGGAGTDSLFGGADNDALYDDAGFGNTLFGEAGNDTLTGIGTLDGGDGNDTLTGGAGTATLMGGLGDDTLIAGIGSTMLSGGAGNDVYVYARGNGADTLSQSDSSAVRLDILRFAVGISPSDIVFESSSLGDLIVRFRMPDGSLDPSDMLTTVRSLDNDALTLKVDRIEFTSFPGTVWTTAQIEQMVFTPTDGDNYIRATQGDDVVNGLGGFDTINGQGGNDILNGGDGNDTLLGGAGNDTLRSGSGFDTLRGESGDDVLVAEEGRGTLVGGVGSDTYLISRAREAITLNDIDFSASSVDVLKLDTGISLASTRMRRSGNNLIITVRDLSRPDGLALNTITVAGYFTTSSIDRIVDEVRFADEAGIVLRYADVQALTLTSDDAGETLTGFTGNDVIRGNGGNDTLSGLDGNDDLDGGTGNDTLNGAAGNDIYRFGTGYGSDTIVDSAGTDRIELNAGIAPADVSLYRTSTVGSDSLVLVLSNGNQQIKINNYFAAGDAQRIEEIRFADGTVWNTTTILANVINLAGTANAQSGTSGNDTFTVDHPSDTVSEAVGAGTDTISASVTYALPSNVENLTLTGPLNISATGNTLANVLRGNAVDNTLDGGAGADTLIGEAGDDTYVVDQINTSSWGSNYLNFQDVVTEAAGQGIDTILADTYSAILPDNVERLILRTALAGPNSVLATIDWRRKFIGNASDNYIDVSGVSPSAWRTFVIDGGAGADVMIGRTGENVYVVDNTGDFVIELDASADGSQSLTERDRIESSVTYTASTWIEDLTLLGTDAISGTGNALNNIIAGNGASNGLSGLAGDDQINGGAGGDTMIGGQGNDRYWVDQSGDSVVENAGEGIDTVIAAVAHTLADNVELLFFGAAIGTGTGNAGANLLRAAASNDVLVGGGGNDILEGLAGDDTLSNTGSENSLLNGGGGADQLSGAGGNDLLIGGFGNDSFSGAGGADIIAFNLGDGQDTVASAAGQDHTVSLGGGMVYADLLFEKDADDLVLRIGATDQLMFADYYAGASNRNVSNLQILIEDTSDYDAGSTDITRNQRVQTFDFEGLVEAFDAARVVDPGLTSWALTDALLAEHLAGSDTAAIGGDLAYWYGRFGSLMQVSFTPALGILSNGSFGSSAQTLQDLVSLQDTSPRLS